MPVAIVAWPTPSCDFRDIPAPPEVKVYVPPSAVNPAPGAAGPIAGVGLERIYVTMRNLEDILEYNKALRSELLSVRACLGHLAKIVEIDDQGDPK